MGWKKDTIFEVLLTRKPEIQIQKILDYIFYELKMPRLPIAWNMI